MQGGIIVTTTQSKDKKFTLKDSVSGDLAKGKDGTVFVREMADTLPLEKPLKEEIPNIQDSKTPVQRGKKRVAGKPFGMSSKDAVKIPNVSQEHQEDTPIYA